MRCVAFTRMCRWSTLVPVRVRGRRTANRSRLQQFATRHCWLGLPTSELSRAREIHEQASPLDYRKRTDAHTEDDLTRLVDGENPPLHQRFREVRGNFGSCFTRLKLLVKNLLMHYHVENIKIIQDTNFLAHPPLWSVNRMPTFEGIACRPRSNRIQFPALSTQRIKSWRPHFWCNAFHLSFSNSWGAFAPARHPSSHCHATFDRAVLQLQSSVRTSCGSEYPSRGSRTRTRKYMDTRHCCARELVRFEEALRLGRSGVEC